jgi:elongation factor G
MAHSTTAIRNICFAGHAGSGKTTLLEAVLWKAGRIGTPGRIEAGDTVSDFRTDEKRLGHSVESTLCSFDHGDVHLNLIDTPGYPDLIGRAFATFAAVETVAVVVNAQVGIEPATEIAMQRAAERRCCRMFIVNRIDAPDADPAGVLEQLRERFGAECLPLNLPVDRGRGIADCFFKPPGGDSDLGSIADAHAHIVDQVVELDDELMELYLEQGENLDPEQLHEPFERALRDGHLIPVCFTSARDDIGIEALLSVFERLLPSPDEGNPPQFLKGEGADATAVELSTSPDAHALAHAFKVMVDPFRGRLALLRVHQGSLRVPMQLYVGVAHKPLKVAHLLNVFGAEQTEIVTAVAGDICAIPRAEGVHFDAVLHDSHDEDHYHLQSVEFPPPMHAIAIAANNDAEAQKVSDALHTLRDEDPSMRVEHVVSLNETVLHGLGELHLEVVLDRIRDQYNVEVATRLPRIAYRETITVSADGHHRHKKQTGGAGQFGEVFLRVDPLPRGAGFEFVSEVVGGAIPSQFIPAVEKGVRQALESGACAGYPLHDLKVTVLDGKHHSVDSKEIAFVVAGRTAFLDAVKKAVPIILEPIAEVTVIAPAACMGEILGDVSRMRGMITGTESLSRQRVRIKALVPLAEMQTYHSRLKALSGGTATFLMTLHDFAQAPESVKEKLVAGFAGHAEI